VQGLTSLLTASATEVVLIVPYFVVVVQYQSLGENFSATLHVREQHTLVMEGPYCWVRHPLYSTMYVLLVAFILLSANWFIGLASTGGLTLVVASRVKREEMVMIEKFGDRYREYMSHTGRFLPRLGH